MIQIPRRIRLLSNVFFGRLFENDIFSSSMAATSSMLFLLALTAVPGMLMSFSQIFAWAALRHRPLDVQYQRLLESQTFHLDFVMGLAGLVTMMVWGSMTPDRRDALVLGPLPVTAREQASARLLALLRFFGQFVVAVSVPTAVVFTFVSTGAEHVLEVPQRIAGHISAAMLSGAFIFFTLLNIQLLAAAVFGPRAMRFITLPLQLGSLVGVVAALAFSDALVRTILASPDNPGAVLLWNPPAWFVGVYKWMMGDDRPVYAMLASRGAAASLITTAIALTLYPLAYERCLRNVIDSEGRRTSGFSRNWIRLAGALLRPILRTPLERGLATYMLATFARSHTHRFFIGGYAGIAFLLSLPIGDRLLHHPVTARLQYAWFAIPLGITFWIVCGTRVSLMIPIEPVANWAFRLTEPVDKRRVLTTVVTVMATLTALPISMLFGSTAALLGAERLGLAVLLIVFLAGLCLIEALTFTMKAVPYTCTYLPGQLNLRWMWPIYFTVWLQFVFRLADWGVWASASYRRTAQLAGSLLLLWVVLRIAHLVRAKRIKKFVYDEQPPPLTVELMNSLKQA